MGVLHPLTQMVFTRDYRIFGQFSNFPDDKSAAMRQGHIKSVASPSTLHVMVAHQDKELGTEYIPVDGKSQTMSIVKAGQLKDLDMPCNTTANNMAIKAFVDQLADDIPIIICWI